MILLSILASSITLSMSAGNGSITLPLPPSGGTGCVSNIHMVLQGLSQNFFIGSVSCSLLAGNRHDQVWKLAWVVWRNSGISGWHWIRKSWWSYKWNTFHDKLGERLTQIVGHVLQKWKENIAGASMLQVWYLYVFIIGTIINYNL